MSHSVRRPRRSRARCCSWWSVPGCCGFVSGRRSVRCRYESTSEIEAGVGRQPSVFSCQFSVVSYQLSARALLKSSGTRAARRTSPASEPQAAATGHPRVRQPRAAAERRVARECVRGKARGGVWWQLSQADEDCRGWVGEWWVLALEPRRLPGAVTRLDSQQFSSAGQVAQSCRTKSSVQRRQAVRATQIRGTMPWSGQLRIGDDDARAVAAGA